MGTRVLCGQIFLSDCRVLSPVLVWPLSHYGPPGGPPPPALPPPTPASCHPTIPQAQTRPRALAPAVLAVKNGPLSTLSFPRAALGSNVAVTSAEMLSSTFQATVTPSSPHLPLPPILLAHSPPSFLRCPRLRPAPAQWAAVGSGRGGCGPGMSPGADAGRRRSELLGPYSWLLRRPAPWWGVFLSVLVIFP